MPPFPDATDPSIGPDPGPRRARWRALIAGGMDPRQAMGVIAQEFPLSGSQKQFVNQRIRDQVRRKVRGVDAVESALGFLDDSGIHPTAPAAMRPSIGDLDRGDGTLDLDAELTRGREPLRREMTHLTEEGDPDSFGQQDFRNLSPLPELAPSQRVPAGKVVVSPAYNRTRDPGLLPNVQELTVRGDGTSLIEGMEPADYYAKVDAGETVVPAAERGARGDALNWERWRAAGRPVSEDDPGNEGLLRHAATVAGMRARRETDPTKRRELTDFAARAERAAQLAPFQKGSFARGATNALSLGWWNRGLDEASADPRGLRPGEVEETLGPDWQGVGTEVPMSGANFAGEAAGTLGLFTAGELGLGAGLAATGRGLGALSEGAGLAGATRLSRGLSGAARVARAYPEFAHGAAVDAAGEPSLTRWFAREALQGAPVGAGIDAGRAAMNDQPIAPAVATGLLTGAAAGPVLAGGLKAAGAGMRALGELPDAVEALGRGNSFEDNEVGRMVRGIHEAGNEVRLDHATLLRDRERGLEGLPLVTPWDEPPVPRSRPAPAAGNLEGLPLATSGPSDLPYVYDRPAGLDDSHGVIPVEPRPPVSRETVPPAPTVTPPPTTLRGADSPEAIAKREARAAKRAMRVAEPAVAPAPTREPGDLSPDQIEEGQRLFEERRGKGFAGFVSRTEEWIDRQKPMRTKQWIERLTASRDMKETERAPLLTELEELAKEENQVLTPEQVRALSDGVTTQFHERVRGGGTVPMAPAAAEGLDRIGTWVNRFLNDAHGASQDTPGGAQMAFGNEQRTFIEAVDRLATAIQEKNGPEVVAAGTDVLQQTQLRTRFLTSLFDGDPDQVIDFGRDIRDEIQGITRIHPEGFQGAGDVPYAGFTLNGVDNPRFIQLDTSPQTAVEPITHAKGRPPGVTPTAHLRVGDRTIDGVTHMNGVEAQTDLLQERRQALRAIAEIQEGLKKPRLSTSRRQYLETQLEIERHKLDLHANEMPVGALTEPTDFTRRGVDRMIQEAVERDQPIVLDNAKAVSSANGHTRDVWSARVDLDPESGQVQITTPEFAAALNTKSKKSLDDQLTKILLEDHADGENYATGKMRLSDVGQQIHDHFMAAVRRVVETGKGENLPKTTFFNRAHEEQYDRVAVKHMERRLRDRGWTGTPRFVQYDGEAPGVGGTVFDIREDLPKIKAKIGLKPSTRGFTKTEVAGGVAAIGAGAAIGATQGETPQERIQNLILGGVAGAAAAALPLMAHDRRSMMRMLMTDELTGVGSGRAYRRALESMGDDHVVVRGDAKNLKWFNDHGGGEKAGDQYLKGMSAAARQAAREVGIPERVFRIREGGDEMAALVPREQAEAFAKRWRELADVGTVGEKFETGVRTGIGADDAEAEAAVNAGKKTEVEGYRRPEAGKGTAALAVAGATAATLAGAEALSAQIPGTKTADKGDPTDNTTTGQKALAVLGAGIGLMMANRVGKGALKNLPEVWRRVIAGGSIAAAGGTLAATQTDEEWKSGGEAMVAMGMLSMVGGRNIFAGLSRLGTKATQELANSSSLGRRVARSLNPSALVDPEVKAAIESAERTVARGRAVGSEFAGRAARLGDGDPQRNARLQRALSDEIEGGAQIEPRGDLTRDELESVAALARDYAERSVAADRDAVAAEVLTPETSAKFKEGASYLPREYAEHIDAGNLEGRASRPLARMDASQARTLTDSPEDLATRAALGEIREGGWRMRRRFEQGYQRIAARRVQQTLMSTPGAIEPNFLKHLEGLRPLKDEETALLRQVNAAKEAGTDVDPAVKEQLASVRERIAPLEEQMEAIRRRVESNPGGPWRVLPRGRGYRELGGAVVPWEIHNELVGMSDFRGVGAFMRLWKKMKTVYNPGTSVGNVMANMSMLGLRAGVGPHRMFPVLAESLDDLTSYGDATRALAEAGALNADEVVGSPYRGALEGAPDADRLFDLRDRTRPETAEVLKEKGVIHESERHTGASAQFIKAIEDISGRVRSVDQRASRFYQNEDNLFRIAAYTEAKKNGATEDEAIEAAKDVIGEFRTRSPAIRLLGNSVAPFILVQAKLVPKALEGILDHPWRWAMMAGAVGLADDYAEQVDGPVAQEDVAPQDREGPAGMMLPTNIQLPEHWFPDSPGMEGTPMANIQRWTPLSGITNSAPPGTVPGRLSDDWPAILSPSGPLTDLGAAVVGYDPFTGRERFPGYLTTESGEASRMPFGEMGRRTLGEAWKFMAPSALGPTAERVGDDLLAGNKAAAGTDALGLVGMRPRFLQPGSYEAQQNFLLEQGISQAQQDHDRLEERTTDPKRLERLDAILDERIRQLEQRYNRRTLQE